MKYALILCLLLLAGCTSSFQPDVSFSVDQKSVKLDGISMSEDFVTVTVTRNDATNENTPFILAFPDNYSRVYPIDIDGNRITFLETKPLRGKNAKDTLQFKVFGEKGEAQLEEYTLHMQLMWNGTIATEKELAVIIK